VTPIAPLRSFIHRVGSVLEETEDEPDILAQGLEALSELVATDEWLPPPYARPDADHYQQYLLHCDSLERFSVVSFVWGPGQRTPIHDHCTWGLIGILRGAERSQRYELVGAGSNEQRLVRQGPEALSASGSVDAVSPRIGDIHAVWNESADDVAIGIHVYGGNIGAIHRHVYDSDGATREFVSGYANATVPNIWGS
jgi:predicted metal-dependent enzyme (double-stranded beta helix superfamily)